MRFHKMQTQPRTTVTVPQLNGGVNLNDLPNHVNDNQLTACNNVWWHDGALQTRPGLTVKQEGTLPVGATGAVARFVTGNPVSEREVLLGQFREPPAGATTGTFWGYSLDLDNGLINLGRRVEVSPDEDGHWSALGVKASKGSDTDYYFFLSDGSVLQQGELPADGSERELVDAEPYVPLVTVNGRGGGHVGECTPGVYFEGYNMLTGKYRCGFTTDGESTVYAVPKTTDSVTTISVELLVSDGGSVRTIQLENIKKGGNYVTITSAEAGGKAQEYFPDESSFEVAYRSGDTGSFRFVLRKTDASGGITWPVPAVENNNMIITVEADASKQRNTICRMTRCAEFGGDRSGVNGGTRLFVCGNPDKPNLVHWSDVNNPLYFPENNYAYIGSGDEAVTGFGKQGDLLVMFKKHEIYAAQYVAGTDFTYEDVINGKVTDVTAYLAQFPIIPLHPSIGCDCPDTIRLVNNKLVWLTGDGRVHILTGANQYSERNVRQASPLIEKELKKHSKAEMQAAVAGEYEGYYVLLIGNRMYLLDCQTSAFNSFQYYSREETAQKALPWYIWTLDSGVGDWMTMVSDAGRLYILEQSAYLPVYGGQEWVLYTLQGDTDNGAAIESSFTTKLYDFARVDTKKSIDQVYISVGDVEGCRIRVGYVTDRYTAEDAYVIECTGETGGSVQPYRVTSNVRLVQRFGLTLSAENPMTVSGLTIKYKNQGVVR